MKIEINAIEKVSVSYRMLNEDTGYITIYFHSGERYEHGTSVIKGNYLEFTIANEEKIKGTIKILPETDNETEIINGLYFHNREKESDLYIFIKRKAFLKKEIIHAKN